MGLIEGGTDFASSENWRRWCDYEIEVSAGWVAQCRRIHEMLDYCKPPFLRDADAGV